MRARLVCAVAACVVVAGCGATTPAKERRAGGGIPESLLAGERPVGRGARFQPALRGAVSGPCTVPLGKRRQIHVEVFGANRVVLVPAGIGTRPPRELADGRVVRAACFGEIVTLDPTGAVYLRPGVHVTLGDLFDAWGQRLTTEQVASFKGGPVRVYVNGRQRRGPPRSLSLVAGTEVVLEVGPYVPPHRRFAFTRVPRLR